jgi:hypothetical protein
MVSRSAEPVIGHGRFFLCNKVLNGYAGTIALGLF